MNYSKFFYYGFKLINAASVSLAIKEYLFDISFIFIFYFFQKEPKTVKWIQ